MIEIEITEYWTSTDPDSNFDDIKSLIQHANISIPVFLESDVCQDPDDIKVFGSAVASNADYILTGDKDLLVLKSLQGLRILNPRSFSDIVHSGQK